MPSNHLFLYHPLLLPSIFLSIRVFSNKLAHCIRWSKYWSFIISPSNEYSRLISFRIDWFDLLAVQGTLKSLLQHHSSKGSILWHSAFFIVQLSHLYMTTGKATYVYNIYMYTHVCIYTVVQFRGHVQLFATPRTAPHQTSLFFPIFQILLKFMPIASVTHLTISSSVSLFSFCLQSFPA